MAHQVEFAPLRFACFAVIQMFCHLPVALLGGVVDLLPAPLGVLARCVELLVDRINRGLARRKRCFRGIARIAPGAGDQRRHCDNAVNA